MVFLFFLATVLLASHSRALPPDPAGRGLDLFVHVASDAAPGGVIELTAEAFGFATVTDAKPLSGAIIEAGWDPESIGGDAPPPTVTAKTDAEGRVRLAVEVPPGPAGPLSLLVGARHGSHTRTHSVTIKRSTVSHIELHTADSRVVPTSTISAWARVAGVSGKPIAGAAVTVELLEGGVARHTQRLVSDRGGMVMARVPIPRIDEPVWQWTLRASPLGGEGTSGGAQVELTPREEVPGTPTLEAHWDTPRAGALAGDRIAYSVRLRDATGQPQIDHPITWWIGPKGTTPPASDEDWKKHGTPARTDAAGLVVGFRDAPTLVKSTGTALQLVVRTVVEGHPLLAQHDVAIGAPNASASLVPEVGSIVPGLSQRMRLRVLDGRSDGVGAKFRVTGDGLARTVTTDAKGEAEITWDAPRGVGATRNVGPCAGGVAAAVTVRQEGDVPALRNQREGFVLCVAIDRDADGILRVEPTVARPGDKVKVTVNRTRPERRSYSAIAASNRRAQSVATWLEGHADGTSTGEIVLPAEAGGGVWTISAVLPEGARVSNVLSAALLVVPKTAPLLTAMRVGGRAAPGGKVEVEAVLSDGHGRGLQGAVSAIVVDAFGGGDARVTGLDTRSRLCAEIGADNERCAAVLEADPSTAALRRALLSKAGTSIIKPSNDPGEHASEEMRKAFAEVVRSLEGAVFEATKTAQTLLDVRRKENGRWIFNPEMFTLVTDAMDDPPLTPGGEKLTLADLSAVDPQVTFDNVARRVTRLKMFRVLMAVREVRSGQSLDPDEPVFKDPNALLRRLVRNNTLTDDVLLDPWGGTIQFVKSGGPSIPFLSVARGFELRSPGPDGMVNTADDLRDPFERVLRSGSPYAVAVEEDRIVDAKWDMVVSEGTVQLWKHLFEELTGKELGSGTGGGFGVMGEGEGGGGRGEGIGLGRIGTLGHGSGTGTMGISTGDAYWTPPVRTDAEGRVKMTIPLGAVETTWRVAFVAVPDGFEPAATTLDVASEAPLSGRVDSGARWVVGDAVETNVVVRNRTKAALRATVSAAAEGAVALDTKSAPITVDVPANGVKQVRVRATAKRAGEAALVVTTRAPGVPDDVLRHTWEVVPAGERRAVTQTAWIDGEQEIGVVLDHGYTLMGEPRVVLERGYDDAVAAALDSLEPERQTSALALVDALEAALRIERWATLRSTPRHRALAEIAKGIGERARGRFGAYTALDETSRGATAPGLWTLKMRVRGLTKDWPLRSGSVVEAADEKDGVLCPPPVQPPVQSSIEDALDAEPAPAPDVLPCWGAYVANATRAIDPKDSAARASAILALAERPHRAALTTQLADQLRREVKLLPTGDIDAPGLEGRAPRATIYAALLRAQKFGHSGAGPDALFGKIAALRDVTGGYGSSSATLAVVRALLSSQLAGHGVTHARVRVMRPGQGVLDKRVDVPADGFISVALPANAVDVAIETEGPGLIARLERPVLRSWTRPPPPQASPVNIEIVWPAEARAGSTGTLRIMLRHDRDHVREVDVRIPLPPGVTLAAPTAGCTQLQGVLAIRESVSRAGAVIEAPVRFGLAGKVMVPEAIARLTRAANAPATAPARALVVR